MTEDIFEEQKNKLTPETGFNLVGIDYFAEKENQVYLIEYFEMYQDALNDQKKEEKSGRIFYFIQRIRRRISFQISKKFTIYD